MRTTSRKWGLLLLALVPASCVGPDATYIAADRATFEAVAPEYLEYVQADESLDAAAKARRTRTIETWQKRLEAAEGANR